MKKYLPIIVLFLFGLGIGIWEGHQSNPNLNPLSKLVLYAFFPLQKAVNSIASLPSKAVSYIRLNSTLKAENLLLKKVIEEYRFELAQLEESANEARRLRELLTLKETTSYPTIAARVIGWVPGSHTFIINKGRNQGVKIGKAVIAPEGLVGQVIKSTGDEAIVMAITHPKSGVGALLQASREMGIIQGRGDDILNLSFLPLNAKIEIGEEILTSGMGGIYPKGIPIGSVIRIHTNEATSSIWAEVKPAVDFQKLEEVLVIR
ncbi:MAG: rod shape-determining protein MreC [bacterium]